MPKGKVKIVEHTGYAEAYQRLREFHEAASDGLPCDHLKVLGPSGSGKTTLLEDYAARHPRYDIDDRTVVPILYSRVPPRPSIKKLSARMLYDLKSPHWNKGDELDRTFQLYTLLRECKTEMVMVDEVQHLVDRGQQKTHALVADWLKEAADETGIPWVIAGLPRTQMLDRANDQFARRFSGEIVLERFDPANEGDQLIISGIVADQLEQFGVRLDPGLDPTEVAIRVGYAGDGIIGYMLKINAEVARIQRRENLAACDLDVFSRSFLYKVWTYAPATRNPFKAAVDGLFVRLTGTGEPFAPTEEAAEDAS